MPATGPVTSAPVSDLRDDVSADGSRTRSRRQWQPVEMELRCRQDRRPRRWTPGTDAERTRRRSAVDAWRYERLEVTGGLSRLSLVAQPVALLVFSAGCCSSSAWPPATPFNGGGRPSGNAVDIGFLQDMRAHHDRCRPRSAYSTASEKPAAEQDAVLRSIAKTIISDQHAQRAAWPRCSSEISQPPANEIAGRWRG